MHAVIFYMKSLKNGGSGEGIILLSGEKEPVTSSARNSSHLVAQKYSKVFTMWTQLLTICCHIPQRQFQQWFTWKSNCLKVFLQFYLFSIQFSAEGKDSTI